MRGYVFYSFLLSCLLWQCKQNDIVATVGRESIYKSEIEQKLKQKYTGKNDFQDIPAVDKKNVLDDLINQKLKLLHAHELELDMNPQFMQRVSTYLDGLMLDRYNEKYIMDKVVSKRQVQEYLENLETEVHIAVIFIAFAGAEETTSKTKPEAKSLANIIKTKIDQGTDFSELAIQYSDDPNVKQNNGDYSYVTWGSLEKVVQDAAWSMKPGAISDPIESKSGYYVIKVLDRRKRADFRRPDDRQSLYEIKEKILSDNRQESNKIWKAHRDKLQEKYNYRLRKSALLRVQSIVKNKLEDGIVRPEEFKEDDKKILLASWDDNNLTLNDMLIRQNRNVGHIVSNYNQLNVLKNDVEIESSMRLFLHDARQLGFADDSFVSEQYQQFYDKSLIELLEFEEISQKINVSDEDARSYYQEHAKEFEQEPEIELWEIFVRKKDQAEALLEQIKSGQNFTDLARIHSENKPNSERGGYLGFIKRGGRGLVSLKAHEIGKNQVSGPIKFQDGWSIIKTGDLKPARLKPFERVKGRIKAIMNGERFREKQHRWLKDLRDKYVVTINEEILLNI